MNVCYHVKEFYVGNFLELFKFRFLILTFSLLEFVNFVSSHPPRLYIETVMEYNPMESRDGLKAKRICYYKTSPRPCRALKDKER